MGEWDEFEKTVLFMRVAAIKPLWQELWNRTACKRSTLIVLVFWMILPNENRLSRCSPGLYSELVFPACFYKGRWWGRWVLDFRRILQLSRWEQCNFEKVRPDNSGLSSGSFLANFPDLISRIDDSTLFLGFDRLPFLSNAVGLVSGPPPGWPLHHNFFNLKRKLIIL